MTRTFTLIAAILSLATLSHAQSDCACCTEHRQQFDFWVGEWNVFNPAGTQVGENRIEKVEQGCILNEHWKGSQGGTGSSYNYFDLSDSTWNQLWIDNQGKNLKLKGRLDGNKIILRSDLQTGKKVDFYYNKVSWTNNDDGTVTQLWEVLDKDNQLLSVAFNGTYKRK